MTDRDYVPFYCCNIFMGFNTICEKADIFFMRKPVKKQGLSSFHPKGTVALTCAHKFDHIPPPYSIIPALSWCVFYQNKAEMP